MSAQGAIAVPAAAQSHAQPAPTSSGAEAPAARDVPAEIAPPALPNRTFLFAPLVRVSGPRTIARLPLDGTLEAMRIVRWAAPLALNLYVPNGRIPLSQGLYRTRKGPVRAIAVKFEGGEQLVRVQLTAVPARYDVRLEGGMLELSLELE